MRRSWAIVAAGAIVATAAVLLARRRKRALARQVVELESAQTSKAPSKYEAIATVSKSTPKATPPATADAAHFSPGFDLGARVSLTGLASKPELNGQHGSVVGLDANKGRLNIKLDSGRTLQVKPTNLASVSRTDPSRLTARELCGLTCGDHNALTAEHA